MDVHAVIFRNFVSLCCAAKVDCSLDWHLTIFGIRSCSVKISSAFTLLNMLESREITKLVVGSVLSQEVSCFLVYLKCWGAWNTMFHFCSMTLVHKIFFRLIVSHVRTTIWKRKKKHFFFLFFFPPPYHLTNMELFFSGTAEQFLSLLALHLGEFYQDSDFPTTLMGVMFTGLPAVTAVHQGWWMWGW